MSDLIDVYAQAAGRSAATITVRCRVLRHADRHLPGGLDTACADDLAAYLAQTKTAWTRHTYWSHLRGYYRTMVRAGRLTMDPMAHLDSPAQGDSMPNPVSDEELARAIADSPEQPWRTAVILAAYAGLRCMELVALLREDVTEQAVHIRNGKGGKGRYVPTHPVLWGYIVDRPAGPLVLSATGRPMHAGWISSVQRAHWDALAMPDVHMHRFRHWFGSALVERGVGIEVVRELMGHANIATTQGYVRVSVARQRVALLSLPAIGEVGPARV